MSKSVYIETSVASFFYEARAEPEMVARREWTRQWWAVANKFGHIRRVNTLLGLYVPTLVTPLELLEDEDDAT